MKTRFRFTLAAVALVGAVLVGMPPARSAPTGPTGSRLPSIVEQTLAQVQARARSRSVAPLSSLSNDIVHVDADGRIELAFHADHPTGATEEGDLAKLGATGISSLPSSPLIPKVGIVTAFVPAAQVGAAAALPWAKAVTAPSYGNVDVGSVTSEGVAFHRADIAQTAGFDGTGFDVGVISNGVSNLAASVALGDLPNTVNVLDVGSGDEGTAMLEIVRDMAPGAGLLFDGTNGTVATHVAALNNLVANGAEIITEDIPFDAEPDFQVGLAAQTAENIAAAGVSVHSSAGNLGQQHTARVVATGTGQRPDATANNFTGCTNTPDNVVDVDPGGGTAFDVTIDPVGTPPGPNGTITATLQWSEPRNIAPTLGRGGFTDLNLYVMNATLTQCLAQSVGVQANGVGDTLEQVSFTGAVGTALKLVVDVQGTSTAVTAPTLDLRWRGATATDTPTRAGSLNPDSNYTGQATSAAAINAVSGNIEGFSAGGPVQLGLTTICPGGAAGSCNGVAGGGIVSTPGPTWGAADGVQVTGVGGFGSPFFGTSAAAPHAAACDALVRDARPATNTVALVTARLQATATDLAPAGSDNITGAGQLVCFRADPTVTTTATSSIYTATGSPPISDSATLANGFNPTGPITFQAFGPNNPLCGGAAAFTSAPAVTGNGVYSSGPFTPLAEGEYRWVVTYGGDPNNSLAVSGCNAPNETSTVQTICAAPPAFGTLPGNNVQVTSGVIALGTPGVDVFYGTAGVDRISGAGGNDIVFGLGGDDQIVGGDGLDTLCGGDGNDRITGDAGNDLVVGGNHNDDLTGGAGNDRMIGGSGVVRITGGPDIDACTPGTGAGSQTVLCETIV